MARKSGSLFYNYKGFFSIVLLAIVDGDYKFVWAHVGANGSSSDCDIYNNSDLEPALRECTIGFPNPEPFAHDDRDMPYFIVADDAFPLRPYMVKPFSHQYLSHDERIFNYRCSRARRVVENGFGILANWFRCLLTTMAITPVNSRKVVKACLCLHNVMRLRYPNLQNADLDGEDDNGQVIPGAAEPFSRRWRKPGEHLEKPVQGNSREYISSTIIIVLYRRVPWQEAAINL